MIIKNGNVFQEDGSFRKETLYIRNHRLTEAFEATAEEEVIDAEGLMVIPGLVDIHSHGAYGEDFSDGDPEGLKKILRYERQSGITSYCPTSMTLPKEQLKKIFKGIREAEKSGDGATVAGINMEGPFLDPVKKGAHVEEWITEPDADFVRELNEVSGGRIKLVTLAPNVSGAMEFIRKMQSEVQISLGHTAADYECASEAMALGAHHVTHLYNAMQPLAHREPGLIGAASDDPECMVELICDGYHIHPAVIRATFRMFGPERVILISDSMRATGMKNGTYELTGLTLLDDVEETLGVEFDKEDKDNFDTLNGFMVSRLGHIPKAGEKGSVRIGDYLLKIMKVENKVIQTVLAIPLPKEEKK